MNSRINFLNSHLRQRVSCAWKLEFSIYVKNICFYPTAFHSFLTSPLIFAFMAVGKESFPTIYIDSQKENERWDIISKSQMKNIKKLWHGEQMKSESREKKEAEDNLRKEKNLEEAKKITIKNDPSLPEPQCVKICALEGYRGGTVKLLLQRWYRHR
uniref:Asparagine--tRNA ligase N-terminal domain-containing protein n=1 Tax=Sciurus vulgaris TaxID=55149 RepID=A0A8D2DC29_SCIVU